MQIKSQELEALIKKIALQKYTEQTTMSQKKIRVGHVTIALDRLAPMYAERIMKYFTSANLEFIKEQLFNISQKLEHQTLEKIEIALQQLSINLLNFEDIIFSQFCLIEETTQETLTKVSQIGLPQGDQPSVIHEMKGVNIIWGSKFSNLKSIDLSQMRITSVEGLSFCGLPVVQSLNLEKNLITNISIFSKCKFPCLTVLNLKENQIKEGEQLSKFNSPKLTHFQIVFEQNQPHNWHNRRRRFRQLELNNQRNVKTQLEVINFIFKTESFSNLKQFKIVNQENSQIARIRPTQRMVKRMERIDSIFLYYNELHRQIRRDYRRFADRLAQHPREGRIRHLLDQIRDAIIIEHENNNIDFPQLQ